MITESSKVPLMSNFRIDGESADSFISEAYLIAERTLFLDLERDSSCIEFKEPRDFCNPLPREYEDFDGNLLKIWEWNYPIQGTGWIWWDGSWPPREHYPEGIATGDFQSVADHLFQELKPLYEKVNTPEIDYRRLDHRRAYVLYYLAPYAGQLAYWISYFDIDTLLKEFCRTVVLIGTGPSPEMMAIEYFLKNSDREIFYHCIDINPEWQTQVMFNPWNDLPSSPNHEYHFADVSDPDCWENLPIDLTKVDLVVCQNFLNEISNDRKNDFQQSFAVLYDSLEEGTGLLFSDLGGYEPKILPLERFWEENASFNKHTVVNDPLEVHIPRELFPKIIGALTNPRGQQMRDVWRKRYLKTFAKYIVKTNSTSAVEHYRDYDDEVFPI